MSTALDIVGAVYLAELMEHTPVPRPARVVRALAIAAEALENEVHPSVAQAFAHSPESREAMRLANFYAEGKAIRNDDDVAEVLEDILDDVQRLRAILVNVREWAVFSRTSQSRRAQWPYAVGAAFTGSEGLLHFAADVLELLGYGPCASHLRKGVSALRPREGGYAFYDIDYDDDYDDVVVVSDSE